MYANHSTQPTANAARTDSTFFANVYAPPDSGNAVEISADAHRGQPRDDAVEREREDRRGPGHVERGAGEDQHAAAEDPADADERRAEHSEPAFVLHQTQGIKDTQFETWTATRSGSGCRGCLNTSRLVEVDGLTTPARVWLRLVSRQFVRIKGPMRTRTLLFAILFGGCVVPPAQSNYYNQPQYTQQPGGEQQPQDPYDNAAPVAQAPERPTGPEYIDVQTAPEGSEVPAIEVFYDQLEQHGSWYDDPTYG